MSKIELLGAGTPNLPGGIKNKEFEKILGDRDNVFGIQKLKDILLE